MADAGTLTLDPLPAAITEAPAATPSAVPSRRSHAVLAAAVVIITAGAAIRFALLATSIWFDEAVSVRDVSGSFSQMLHQVVNHEAAPPFYFICLWIWRHLVGSTAVDLRALSALAGTMTIALAFYVGRRRIGQRAALVLAACVAVSPVLVYYSTQMRMYGLLILLSGVGFEAFLRSSKSPNRWNLSVWAGASLLAVATQYYAALAIAPQAALLIALAWRTRPRSRGILAAVGGVTVGVLPLIYLMVYQTRHAWAYVSTALSSTWQEVPVNLHSTNSTLGSLTQDLVIGPGGAARTLLTLLILLIVVVAVVLLLRRPQAAKGQLMRAFVLTMPALVVVEVLLYLHILVEGRYLLPLWLPVGLAAIYTLLSAGWLGRMLIGVLACAWVGIGVVTFTVPKFGAQDDTLGAARSLEVARTDRLIVISQPWDVVPFEVYRPQTSADTQPVVRVRELDVVAMPLEGEPPPSEHLRPASLGTGAVPKGLRLAQIIRGSTFLVERFVAATPVSIRVDGHGSAFAASNWRFLDEPAGGRMGDL